MSRLTRSQDSTTAWLSERHGPPPPSAQRGLSGPVPVPHVCMLRLALEGRALRLDHDVAPARTLEPVVALRAARGRRARVPLGERAGHSPSTSARRPITDDRSPSLRAAHREVAARLSARDRSGTGAGRPTPSGVPVPYDPSDDLSGEGTLNRNGSSASFRANGLDAVAAIDGVGVRAVARSFWRSGQAVPLDTLARLRGLTTSCPAG